MASLLDVALRLGIYVPLEAEDYVKSELAKIFDASDEREIDEALEYHCSENPSELRRILRSILREWRRTRAGDLVSLSASPPVAQVSRSLSNASNWEEGLDSESLLFDVIEHGPYILVVAELPGVKRNELDIQLLEGSLYVKVNSKNCKLRRYVALPDRVEREPMETSFKNGVLLIRLRKRP
ncbi:MAG: Hsp20 family protein [Candidatus Bathyarchaeia archaeon]